MNLTPQQIELLKEVIKQKHLSHPIVCLYALDQDLVDSLCKIIIEQEDELSELRS